MGLVGVCQRWRGCEFKHRTANQRSVGRILGVLGALTEGVENMSVHHGVQAIGVVFWRGLTLEPLSRRAQERRDKALAYEWGTLWVVMALTVANIVLGVMRPRLSRPSKQAAGPAIRTETDPPSAATTSTDPAPWYLKR